MNIYYRRIELRKSKKLVILFLKILKKNIILENELPTARTRTNNLVKREMNRFYFKYQNNKNVLKYTMPTTYV